MKKIVLLVVLLTTTKLLMAQCSIVQNDSNSSVLVDVNEEIGQSFVACNSGALESIEVMISNLSMASTNLELKIATGADTKTGVIHQQTVAVSQAGMLTIPLSEPLLLQSGQLYVFSLRGMGGSGKIDFALGIGDTYPAGNALRNNIQLITVDLEFKVNLGATPIVAASTSIPTMSEWGVLIFALLILNLSLVFMRRLATLEMSAI